MIYPSIKNYRESRRSHFIAPLTDHPEFMGRNSLDIRWDKQKPVANIINKKNLYEVEIAMPGFNKEDIEILIDDDLLTVSAESKKEIEPQDYVLKEFDFELTERTFLLGESIGREKVTATYNSGILKITFEDVPAKDEVPKKRVTIA